MPGKLSALIVGRVLAVAVGTAVVVSLASGQMTIQVGGGAAGPAQAPNAGQGAASEKPAAAPGEPGIAPRPPAPPKEGAPANPLDSAADSGYNIYVDDSFAAVDKLRDADNKAHQGQFEIAIKIFQEIIEKYGQKLVYLNNGSFVSVTDYVRERLLAMPAVKDGVYDQLYGTDAKGAIDQAIAQHDLTNLIRTCDLYFPATASLNGLSQAAEWYFERGEFASAAKIWQNLLNHPMVDHGTVRKPLFLFRAIVALSLSGNKVQAQALRERLAHDYPHAMGPVAGSDADLLQSADAVMAMPAMASLQLAADEWPAFQGAPSHSALLNVNASLEARLWSIQLDDESLTGQRKNSNPNNGNANGVQVYDRLGRQVQPNDPSMHPLNSYPVLSQGTIFVTNGERVTALSVNAGTPLWAYPTTVSIHADNNPMGMPSRLATHDSVSVADDQVFAILPAAGVADAGPNKFGQIRYMGGRSMQNTRVVCLNRQTGAELWSTASSSVAKQIDKPGQMSFEGSPIVTRQGVYVMAHKIGDGGFTEMYLIRLDRETGAPSWYCYLCSTSSPGAMYGMPNLNSTVPIPTLVDDVVYIATGQGADCAVDANAGRILWLSINDTAKAVHSPNEMYNPNYQNAAQSWKFNAPLVFGDKLITCDTAEPAAAVRIYNRANGKLLKTLTKQELKCGRALDVLAGIVETASGPAALVVGDTVTAIDLNTLAVSASWVVDLPLAAETGALHGRPFLAMHCLYMPYEKGLVKLDPQTGQATFSAWPNTEKDVNGKPIPAKPGNLLVTSEQVIVLNDSEIAGYSKWETARDNRLVKIKEHPTDAEPYLALAEVSFRTAHYPLAEENMKRSVELATATESPASAGFVDRLYRTNLNFAEQLLVHPDTETRDQARFYFDQCKLAARGPEQNTEWRLNMSELSLDQNNLNEAASLYNQVLGDAALRNASYHRGDTSSRGAVAAESMFHALITGKDGAAVYQRYEDQAAALLNRAREAKDSAVLEQIVESFPNSKSALEAATELASAAQAAHDPAAQLKPLHWLSSRVSGEKKATVIADTALAYLAMPKHYFAALAFADRGLLLFKDYGWKNAAGQMMTFATLKSQIRASRPQDMVEGRNPILPSPVSHVGPNGDKILYPDMDETSIKNPIFAGALLSPIEPSPIYRRPELLFAYHNGALHIFDTNKDVEITPAQGKGGDGPAMEGGIAFADNGPAQLLGCVDDIALFVQSNSVTAVDLKGLKVVWNTGFKGEETEQASETTSVPRRGGIRMNGGVLVVNGVVQVNGSFIQPGLNGNPTVAADPVVARQIAFGQLTGNGHALGFSTMNIINNRLIVISGDKLSAIDIATGKPAWKNAAGNAYETTLDGGTPDSLVGNEDVIVAQVDNPTEGKTFFRVFDADTGKFRKQIELFQEHPLWRSVSDDGTLFLVTDKAVLAYDLFNDRDAQPLWKRQDVRSPYPAATALTPEGLIVINGNSLDLMCLSAEGGENRWPTASSPPVQLQLHAGAQRPTFIRSMVDGETVVYQSSQGISAYMAAPSSDGDQVAWETTLKPPLPPLQTMELSEPYLVALASGPVDMTQRSVRFFLLNHKGGKIYTDKQLRLAPNNAEGPLIRNWQLADNGIAMEIGDSVFFYHAKK